MPYNSEGGTENRRWSDRRKLKSGKQENHVEQSREIEVWFLRGDQGGHNSLVGALRQHCTPCGAEASGNLNTRIEVPGPSFVGDARVLHISPFPDFAFLHFAFSYSFFEAVPQNQWGKPII